MKISTGLKPVLHAPTNWPQIERAAFVVDDAPIVMPTLPALETHLVTFKDAEGVIRSTALFSKKPDITHRKVELEVYDEAPDMDEWVRHELRREGVPADVVLTTERHGYRHLETRKYEWWEVTA